MEVLIDRVFKSRHQIMSLTPVNIAPQHTSRHLQGIMSFLEYHMIRSQHKFESSPDIENHSWLKSSTLPINRTFPNSHTHQNNHTWLLYYPRSLNVLNPQSFHHAHSFQYHRPLLAHQISQNCQVQQTCHVLSSSHPFHNFHVNLQCSNISNHILRWSSTAQDSSKIPRTHGHLWSRQWMNYTILNPLNQLWLQF